MFHVSVEPETVPGSNHAPCLARGELLSTDFPFELRSDTLRATTSPHVSQGLRGIPVGPLILPPRIWLNGSF